MMILIDFFFCFLKILSIFAQKFFDFMEKMLFEFEYKSDTIYCVVDFFDSFLTDCKTVEIEFLWRDYVHSASLILTIDLVYDVRALQSQIFERVSNCIDSFLNQPVVFKRNWNRFCDSVPQVYQFEKEVLFNDSKIKKFPH